MNSPFKLVCWQSASGRWFCNDIKNLNNKWSKWYAPMRILNLSIDKYITLLIDKFHAVDLFYSEETDYLHFAFAREKDAKAFCSFVNRAFKSYNNK